MRRRAVLCSAVVGGFVLLPIPSAEAGGGGCHEPPTEGTGTMVEMRNACFAPTVLRIDEGESVTFVNRDDYEHAAVGVTWGNFQMFFGDQFAQEFPEAGVYPYACDLHPTMTGAIVVEAPVTQPVAAVVPAVDEPSSSDGAAVAVGAGVLAVGLGLGTVGGRRLRRQ